MGKCALILAALISSATLAAAQEIELPPYPEKGLKGTVNPKRLPAPEHPVLQMGAEVWAKNCIICHGTGNFGAPKITGSKFWAPRIAQGIDVLVMAAVRFMISVSGGAEEALSGLETEPPKEN